MAVGLSRGDEMPVVVKSLLKVHCIIPYPSPTPRPHHQPPTPFNPNPSYATPTPLVHQEMLDQLELAGQSLGAVAETFSTLAPFLRMYSIYCSGDGSGL